MTGLMTRFAGASGGGATEAATTFSGGGAAGAGGLGTAAGGTATGGFATGAGGASAFRRRRFATSPGLEMCERSILVLISDPPERAPPPSLAEAAALCPAKNLRTRSASSTSIELECVFFSVTPTLGRTSRMALLLTSNSLARSLIRTLLIRLCSLRKSRQTIITTLTERLSWAEARSLCLCRISTAVSHELLTPLRLLCLFRLRFLWRHEL